MTDKSTQDTTPAPSKPAPSAFMLSDGGPAVLQARRAIYRAWVEGDALLAAALTEHGEKVREACAEVCDNHALASDLRATEWLSDGNEEGARFERKEERRYQYMAMTLRALNVEVRA